MISGTVSYMSPEQARGIKCDEQTDIWAFGCVVYEVLTGRRLFVAETMPDTLLQIVSSDADLSGLPSSTPPRIRRLIEHCVRRDPKRRLQHIGDARLELEDVEEDTSEMLPAVAAAPRHKRLVWTAVLLAAVAAGLAYWVRQAMLSRNTLARSVQVYRLTDRVGLEESPAISPDGKSVVFVAEIAGRRQIWLRLLAGGTPLAITRDDVDHYGPRWSPDSGSIIYYAQGKQPGEAGTIWEISALGGTPQRIVSALSPGDLSRDGRDLAFFRFHESSIELAVASRDGSQIRAVAKLPHHLYYNLRWSPDNRRIAFLRETGGADFSDNLFVQDISGGETRRVFGGTHLLQGFAWTPDGSG